MSGTEETRTDLAPPTQEDISEAIATAVRFMSVSTLTAPHRAILARLASHLPEMLRAHERATMAMHKAVAAIYFADSSDYTSALWSVVRTIDPAVAKLLESDEQGAYNASLARVEAIDLRAAAPLASLADDLEVRRAIAGILQAAALHRIASPETTEAVDKAVALFAALRCSLQEALAVSDELKESLAMLDAELLDVSTQLIEFDGDQAFESVSKHLAAIIIELKDRRAAPLDALRDELSKESRR